MKVAVYGSLLKGLHNHHFLEESKFIQDDLIPGLKMLNLDFFPGCVSGEDDIVVEVYEISEETLELLDRLEGVPNFYERVKTETKSGLDVFVYLLNNSRNQWGNCKIVPDGDWKRWLS